MDKNKDIFGTAIRAYYKEKDTTPITVHSPDFDDDETPVPYLFRTFEEMPNLEQQALDLCKGKVLDVGCGAGSHTLYLQKKKGVDVIAIDTSEGAIEIAKDRGVINIVQKDFYEIRNQKYDTLLLLMNGSGIIGKLDNLDAFFGHCKTLLKENGSVILDSSDLIFLFEDEFIDTEGYYGELKYTLSYKNEVSEEFDWLYIDEETLKIFAEKNNFTCEIVAKGTHYDYLAVLKLS